jgi:hypothetical protein
MFKLALMAGLALVVGAAFAQNSAPSPKTPLTQGTSSVDKNLERDPDNKGLQNAAERQQRNRERFDERDRPARVERPERPARGAR